MTPVAITCQNWRSTSRRSDGRPGDFIGDRPVNSFIHPAGRPTDTSEIEVLRRPVESAQIAAALLDHHAGGRVVVRSAGSAPADRINPAVVDVMRELGLDPSKEFPKPLTSEAVQASDVVITMGCGDACPIFPGKRYLDWDLEDPAGKDVDTVRRIRDEIDQRIRRLLAELLPDTESGSAQTARHADRT